MRHWSLLRESALDALCHYAPSLMTARIVKEALPKEFKRLSVSAIKEANEARRQGQFKRFLRAKASDPFSSAIGIYSIFVMSQIVLARAIGDFITLTAFLTFFLSWYLAAKRCNLTRRKGFSAAFCANFVLLGIIAFVCDYSSKEGLLLKLPFFSEYARVVYLDLLELPWSVPFAVVAAAVAAFIFRFAILFFRDKVEVSLGERRISLGENHNGE